MFFHINKQTKKCVETVRMTTEWKKEEANKYRIEKKASTSSDSDYFYAEESITCINFRIPVTSFAWKRTKEKLLENPGHNIFEMYNGLFETSFENIFIIQIFVLKQLLREHFVSVSCNVNETKV